MAKREATERPRPRDREATEAALIEAATALFLAKGYEGATTRTIAERAGCSEALIQRYFRGKEGLLLAVIQHEGGGQGEQVAFFDRPLADSLELEARAVLAHIVGVLARRATGLRIVLARVLVDANFRDEFNRVTVRKFLQASLEARLARHAAHHRLPADFDPVAAATMLVGLGFQLGFMHREVIGTDPAEVDRLVVAYAAIVGRAFPPTPT